MAQTSIDVHTGAVQVSDPVALNRDQWRQLQQRIYEATAAAQHCSALLELLEKLESAPDVRQACYRLVNELSGYLQCDRVAVGLRRRGKGTCRLLAVSGLAQFDPRSDVTQAMESGLDESVLRGAMTVWPERREDGRESTLALKRLCSLGDSRSVVCLPLNDQDTNAIGAILFLNNKPIEEMSETINFLRALERPVASSLSLLERLESGPMAQTMGKLVRFYDSGRSKVMLVVLFLCLALLAIPTAYKVKCNCQLEPVTRRFIAAPFEGTLEGTLVKPGDVVVQGDVLARMDGREIRWQRAGFVADQNQAAKKRDSALASHNYAEAQIARLEMERLELKIRVLDHRAENLEIKSPLDGIVTSGDLERAQGAPLTLGQTLFEVAPLDEMIVEVAVPQNDIAHVQPGQSVIVHVDAFPGKSWELPLARVHPRSEIRENQNVFIGEVMLDNADGTLRPGMNGRARIVTPRRSLGWILFHKPWQYLLMWMGW